MPPLTAASCQLHCAHGFRVLDAYTWVCRLAGVELDAAEVGPAWALSRAAASAGHVEPGARPSEGDDKLAMERPPPYDVFVHLVAYTGLRFGEAAGLRVGGLDLDRGRLRVDTSLVEVLGQLEETTPNSHRTRTVPVPRFLREQLAALASGRDPPDRLFTTKNGRSLRNSNFRHQVSDPAVRRAGLAPLTPHDLRDTGASLAVASGAAVKAVQRMLGHASAALTLDVYAGLFDDELDDVADRMSGAAEAARQRDVRTDRGPDGNDAERETS